MSRGARRYAPRPLTARQSEALLLLRAYRDEHGALPSLSGAARLFGVKSSIPLLSALATKNMIDYVPGRPLAFTAKGAA